MSIVQNMYYSVKNFYKNKDPYLGMGKSQKLCHKPHYLSFLLGHGSGSLWPSSLKALKYLKVCLSNSTLLNPKDALIQTHPVHYKIVHLLTAFNPCIFPIFPQILSFSSNRKAQNLAPSFQFVTPGKGTHSKSTKPMKFQHLQLPKETKFRPHPLICDPGPVILQNLGR